MKEESSQFFILFILSVCFSRVLKSKSSPSTYNLPQFYLSLYIPPFFFSLQIHTLSTFNNLFTIFSLSLWAQTTFSFSFTFSKEEKKKKNSDGRRCRRKVLGRDADVGRRRRLLCFGSNFYHHRTHSPSHRKGKQKMQTASFHKSIIYFFFPLLKLGVLLDFSG